MYSICNSNKHHLYDIEILFRTFIQQIIYYIFNQKEGSFLIRYDFAVILTFKSN